MEFPKAKLIACALSSLLLSSCVHHPPEMSAADQRLFQQSIITSNLALDSRKAEQNISLYSPIGKDWKQALASYYDLYENAQVHDFDFLQNLGVKLLEQSLSELDPQAQLLSIYGASIAKNRKLLPILEHAIHSEAPQIQLAAIRALAEYHDDEADRILLQGLRSNYLEVCFETAFMLAANKHPNAMGYIESLMHKVPPQLHFLFPSLYAVLDTPQSGKTLKKFLQSSDSALKIEAILSTAKMKRYDLLPTLRSLSKQHDIAQLEACAFTLGYLQDESSVESLQRLSKSPSEYVALSALCALYSLGQIEALSEIEAYAAKGNIYAIHLLRDCECDEKILEALCYHKQDQVRLNAALALLKKKNPLCLQEVRKILIPSDPQRILTPTQSPGKALIAKKWALNRSSLSRRNPYLSEISNQMRQEILTECMELPEGLFLTLASEIVDAHQNDLIPHVISLVQSLKTTHSIELLKEWQQKVGNPFVRAWSNLALFHLDKEGPWKDNILTWVKKQKYHPLIQVKPIVPWNKKAVVSHFELSTEEKSQLLIQSYLALALRQEEEGLNVILSHLASEKTLNKYALAGILIKATE